MSKVTVSSKGQVVIPASIRNRYGIGPGSTVEFVEEGPGIRLVVIHGVVESTLEDGYGMLTYEGPARRLADFDVARAMRDQGHRR